MLGYIGADPESKYIKSLLEIILALLMIPVSLTWTHHVISEPVSRAHRRRATLAGGPSSILRQVSQILQRFVTVPRLPDWPSVKYMILPTLFSECLVELRNVYPQSAIHTWVLKPMLAPSRYPKVRYDGNSFVYEDNTKGAPKVMGILALAFLFEATTTKVITFLLSSLAGTLRVRVEASLLPEDIQTIVPMDRDFGFKPGRNQHRGITFWEAWETLTWSAAWRISKIYAKTYAVGLVLGFTTAIFWASIAFATPGWDLQTVPPDALTLQVQTSGEN